jgi:nuclear pore complex protein Nup98-Nup96
MSANDIMFHNSFKPRWGTFDTFICARSNGRDVVPDPTKPWEQGAAMASEGRIVTFNRFGGRMEVSHFSILTMVRC